MSLVPGAVAEVSDVDIEFFENKIRPVLAEHCYECHGADGEEVESELILNTAKGIRKGGTFGPVIVPGEPDESPLIQAMRHTDPEFQMPEKYMLSRDVIKDFEDWVTRGAFDPRDDEDYEVLPQMPNGPEYDFSAGREHWAYQPIRHSTAPEVDDEGWNDTAIDRFVFSALTAQGLEPVGMAEKRTLIRRATYDLIGLPPKAHEIDAFLRDTEPDAFGRVVDRLLESPQYGERWGRYWLDVVRYADSNGLDENIGFPNAFRYRDYVIASFNSDKPYTDFVREQIAGDLLTDAKSDAEKFDRLTGTGFWSVGAKVLAERDLEKKIIDIVDEQIDVMGKAFIGQTIGCARCHDHKFDPIPTVDYYSMAGILKSTMTLPTARGMSTLERPLATKAEVEVFEAAQKRVDDIEQELAEFTGEINERLRRERRNRLGDYMLAAEELRRLPETSALRMFIPAKHNVDDDVLLKVSEHLKASREESNPVLVIWNAFADAFSEESSELENLRVSLLEDIERDDTEIPYLMQGVLSGGAPESLAELADRYQTLFATVHLVMQDLLESQEESLAIFKMSEEELEEAGLLPYVDFASILYGPKSPLTFPRNREQARYSEEEKERAASLRDRVEQYEAEIPERPPHTMAVRDGVIVDVPVHIRGNHMTLEKTTTPRGFLRVTDNLLVPPEINPEQSGRLELAEWMLDSAHPLTARVMVNRIWQGHFGNGIVNTPNNFGLRGSRPTHPALLDYLATRFVELNWSVKDMHREIMVSRTYRSSSEYHEANTMADPDNRYLWRMSRRKLEAEPIRDALLAVGGNLDLTMGGRVEEYDPRGYVFNEGNTFKELKDTFYTSPRRSVYMPIVRNAMFPMFAVFDYGNSATPVGKRDSTVVPSQSLLMMNSPFVVEQAALFSKELLNGEADTDEGRIETAFVTAYGRPPSLDEVSEAKVFLNAMREVSMAAPEESEDVQRAEEFAWSKLAHVIVASSEFMYID